MYVRAVYASVIRRCLVAICMAILSPFVLPVTLQAQTITGTVQSAGNPIIGATVRLLDLDRVEHTGAQGQFTFSNIPKGIYRVFVGVTGYASTTDTVRVTSD